MVILMKKKKTKLSDIILPSKKINFFVVTVLIFGIVSGAIFLMTLNEGDRSSTVLQIENFFVNINKGSIDNGLAFKNSLIINYIFVFLIWGLGLSIIGVLGNIFLTYIKGFIVGFSISSIMLTYGYKGILASLLYVFPTQVFNSLVVVVLTIYSIMFANNLLGIIMNKKKSNNRTMIKRYTVILFGCVVISFISSGLEIYLFPNLLRIIIDLYV